MDQTQILIGTPLSKLEENLTKHRYLHWIGKYSIMGW